MPLADAQRPPVGSRIAARPGRCNLAGQFPKVRECATTVALVRGNQAGICALSDALMQPPPSTTVEDCCRLEAHTHLLPPRPSSSLLQYFPALVSLCFQLASRRARLIAPLAAVATSRRQVWRRAFQSYAHVRDQMRPAGRRRSLAMSRATPIKSRNRVASLADSLTSLGAPPPADAEPNRAFCQLLRFLTAPNANERARLDHSTWRAGERSP